MPDPLTLPEVRDLLARCLTEKDRRLDHAGPPFGIDWPASLAAVCRLALVWAEEIERLRAALTRQEFNIQSTLARAIGYVEVDGLPTHGDHIAETLAIEAAKEIERLRAMTAIHTEQPLTIPLKPWCPRCQMFCLTGKSGLSWCCGVPVELRKREEAPS